MRRLLALLAVFVVLAASCGSEDSPLTAGADPGSDPASADPTSADPDSSDADGPSEEGRSSVTATEYRAVEITENGVPRVLVADTMLTVHVSPTSIGASLGCNSMGGDYRLDGDVLVVDNLAQTEMGCDPDRHAQDEWFASFLTSRPTLAVDGDTLTLVRSGETATTIVLRVRAAVDPDLALEGTRWVITGFLEGEVAMAFAAPDAGHLTFDQRGSVAEGFDGCTEFSAPYEVDRSDIRFGGVQSDAVACDDPAGEYQARVRAVLVKRVAWEVDADRLTLLAPDGRGVTFQAES